MRGSHSSYLLIFALCLLPAAGIVGANVLYLKHTGEFLALPEIVSRQQTGSGFCIYGTALHDDTFAYKQESYRVRAPTIVAIGSSISMEIRERFFAGTFYNLGGTMDSIINGLHTIEVMSASHTPKLLLLGIDWWWFRDGTEPYQRSRPPEEPPRFTVDKTFRPFAWILQGKVSLRDYILTILRRYDRRDPCAIGVQSIEKRHGFAPDGSYYYASLVTGKDAENADIQFQKEMKAIARGEARFAYGNEINEHALAQFIGMVQDLKTQGISIIPFFHPMSPKVFAEMQKHRNDYRYIEKLRMSLKAAGIHPLDFLDPSSVGSPDCEFIDGIHGGDVTYARLLKRIHDSLKESKATGPFRSGDLSPLKDLRKLFALDTINTTIHDYAGLAMARDPRITLSPETDFLELGCRK